MDENAKKAMELEESRRRRYRQAAALVKKWSEEDSTYDEDVWPLIEQELAKDPMRLRDDEETAS